MGRGDRVECLAAQPEPEPRPQPWAEEAEDAAAYNYEEDFGG